MRLVLGGVREYEKYRTLWCMREHCMFFTVKNLHLLGECVVELSLYTVYLQCSTYTESLVVDDVVSTGTLFRSCQSCYLISATSNELTWENAHKLSNRCTK